MNVNYNNVKNQFDTIYNDIDNLIRKNNIKRSKKKLLWTICWKNWTIVNKIDEIMMSKQCVFNKNDFNRRRNLIRSINTILKTVTISRIFSDVFFLIINIDLMFTSTINIKVTTICKLVISSIIKMIFRTMIMNIKIQIKIDFQTSTYSNNCQLFNDCKLSTIRRYRRTSLQ